MGVFSAAIKGLLASGAPPEVIIQTVEEMEAGCLRFSIPRAPDEKKEPVRETYPEDFAAFWEAYPETRGMDKKEAYKVWQKIPLRERELALRAVPEYAKYLDDKRRKQPDFPVIHACRFLSKGRAESLVESKEAVQVAAALAPIKVPMDDPRYKALVERYRREKGKSPFLDNGASYFPREWMEAT